MSKIDFLDKLKNINMKEENEVILPNKVFTFEVLQVVKDAQMQHGLRHADYQRYRQYCSRRLRRIRKVVHLTQGTKHKVQLKKVTPELLKDHRCLFIPLVEAERSWAYAMQLKSEANTELRKKFHMISRLKKAVQHSSHMNELITNQMVNCDARTKLEVNAYCSWMRGLLDFETQNWKSALENFNKSKIICEKLAEAVSSDVKDIYLQRCSEISPNIRYCEYNIGDTSAIEDLMQMRLNVGMEDPLTSKLDELIEKTRESQSNLLSEVTWLGRTVPVKNNQVRKLLLNLQQFDKQVEEANSDEQKLSMYESLLKEIIDAQQSLRDELKDDVAFKAMIRGQQLEGIVPSTVFLHTYILYIKQVNTVERNLLMIQQLLNKSPKQEDGKKTKPQDLARLYDVLIQILTEILHLPGLEDQKAIINNVNIQITGFRAFRCFYVAQIYESLKKWKETMALYERATIYAKESCEAFKSSTLNIKKINHIVESLNVLMRNIDGLKYSAQASCILDSDESSSGTVSNSSFNLNMPLYERLDNYIDNTQMNSKKTKFVNLPPEFEPIPAKPFFFDLALSLVQFPSLEDRLDQQKKSQSGITGLFKKLWWGAEKN